MRRLVIYAKSTSKKTLSQFKNFINVNKKLNNKTIISVTSTKACSTKISVLKSPHVHKTAQEQFENKNYKTKIIFKTKNVLQLTILIKKLIKELFQNITIKIKKETEHNNIKTGRIVRKIKSFNRINLKPINKKPIKFFFCKEQTKKLIDSLKIMGELILKTVSE